MRVVITGGNRGLGYELTRYYVNTGAEVHVIGRNPCPILNVKNHLFSSLEYVDEDFIKNPIDILINNAGTKNLLRDEISYYEILRMINVNACIPLQISKVFQKNIVEAKGKIINISSRMGSIEGTTNGGFYGYRMSKAALNMITKNLSIDLKGTGCVVASIHPGWIKTIMGGPGATLEAEEAAKNVANLIHFLKSTDSGKFFDSEHNKELPW